MNLRFVLFTVLVIFTSCEEKVTLKPVVISPQPGAIYYPDQLISISWQVPDPSNTVELQLYASQKPDDINSAIKWFIKQRGQLITGNTSYEWTMSPFFEEPFYYFFRLRCKGSSGFGPWTAIQSFVIKPYSALKVEEVNIQASFSFTAESNGAKDYSGPIVSTNSIDLTSILVEQGYDLERLAFIRPYSGNVIDDAGYAFHLKRVCFGFNSIENGAYPFDLLGDARSIGYEPEVTFYPSGGIYRNLYAEIGDESMPMKAVYFLSSNYALSEMIGKPHHMVVSLKLKCFFTGNDSFKYSNSSSLLP